MKSNTKKRLIAFMLCMVLVLSSATSAFADELQQDAEVNTAGNVQEVQAEPVALSEEAQPAAETVEETTEPAQETTEPATVTPANEPAVAETPATEPPAAATPEATVTETAPHQDAMELKQEMKDASGNTVCTVKAEIPEGTFNANTSEVTMEVKDVDDATTKVIKKLMKESLPADKELSHYFLYNISFKVNGQTTEPSREIKITFEKKDFKVKDVKNATVFYYNEANSPAGNVTAEIKEIIQKADKVEELQNAGQSLDNIEDNDLTVISLKADGTADKIETEGRRSTVYGCYIEKDKPVETAKAEETKTEENASEAEEATAATEPAGPTTKAGCYSENGEKLNYEIDLSAVTETTDLNGLAATISNYSFAYISVVNSEQSTDIKRLRTKADGTGGTGLEYSTSETGDVWNDIGTNEIRYIYRRYDTIATVDTSELIDIDLYDYKKDQNCNGLLFNGNASERYNAWIGSWGVGYATGNDSYAVQGIVENQLYKEDGSPLTELESVEGNIQGYPKLTVSKEVAKDLLNSPEATGLNHLFTKDSSGYYEYNSATNYAYYKKSNNLQKNFVVYSQPMNKGGDNEGDFMPLTDITGSSDFYYGMTVGFNFIQPEEGKVNNNPMVFEFSGDDDVWVFVDGKLVLDIGGIHEAVGGSINFATGEVHVNGAVPESQSRLSNTLGTDTTLQKIFGLTGNTFEDYSEHRLEFIYLERGAGESNCHLRFNMPPIPKESLQVTKEITNTDKEKYSNIEFSFKAYLMDSENDTTPEILPDGTKYQIWEDGVNTGQEGEISDGVFKLKHNQTAVFQGIRRNLYYYAEEVAVSSNEFDKVEIPNWNVTYVDDEGNEISSSTGTGGIVEGKSYIARSEVKRVGGNSVIKFQNRCSASNNRELSIKKKMAAGQTADQNETFSFQIFLEDKDGKLIPYGKDEAYYVVQGNKTTKKTIDNTEGIVSGIHAGESVVLTQIMSGTQFKVIEANLDGTKYNYPVYSVENAADEVATDFASGTILLGKNANITVTNSELESEDKPMIKVQKTFKGLTQAEIDTILGFKIAVSKEDGTPVADLTLTGGKAYLENVFVVKQNPTTTQDGIVYTWEIKNVEAGRYKISEDGATLGEYDLTATVNNVELPGEGATVETKDISYTVKKAGAGKLTEQSGMKYNFKDIEVIVISLGSQEGYIVWTEDTLSLAEREGIINGVIKTDANGQFGKSTLGKSDKIKFFSSRQLIQSGFEYKGKISVDSNNNLVFEGGKSQWNMIWLGTYEKNSGSNAEIEILNDYKPKNVLIDLKKFGSEFTQGNEQETAKFSLYKGSKVTEGSNLAMAKWELVKEDFSVTSKGNPELTLMSGYYKLVETVAPTGFVLLDKPIYFKVDVTSSQSPITFINETEGTQLQNPDMWRISPTNNLEIDILNKALYDLPSAGGSGIHWYMISGVLLMLAAVLILYRNKCKEVLER